MRRQLGDPDPVFRRDPLELVTLILRLRGLVGHLVVERQEDGLTILSLEHTGEVTNLLVVLHRVGAEPVVRGVEVVFRARTLRECVGGRRERRGGEGAAGRTRRRMARRRASSSRGLNGLGR